MDKAPVPDGNNAVPKRADAAPKPAQKKPTAKPKPVEVIEISPDAEDAVQVKEKKDKVPVNNIDKKATAGEGSSKKKAHSLTSVLTARSKVICVLFLKLEVEG